MMATHWAIETQGLCRTFRKGGGGWRRRSRPDAAREFVALDHVDLQVRTGELFGLLGPNGAGKTTLIKILTTLLAPTAGRAWVDGIDVVATPEAVRPRINMVSGGETSGYGILNVRENLWLFARLYGVPSATAYERIERMLRIVGLSEQAATRISHLSTGQRQKMNFCRGFITDPKILFLDEPTLGLDVTSARAIRGFLREWLAERPHRTLLLTTHYMAEAEELCDRVAIIDRGRILACDTPAGLKRQVQQHPRFDIWLAPSNDGWGNVPRLPGVAHASVTTGPAQVLLRVALTEEAAIGSVVQAVVESGGRILTLRKVEPTLEDVFIQLVGHGLDADAGDAAPPAATAVGPA